MSSTFYQHFHKLNNTDRHQRKADVGASPTIFAPLRRSLRKVQAGIADIEEWMHDHEYSYADDFALVTQGSTGGGASFAGDPGTIPDYYREGSGKGKPGKARKAATLDESVALLRATALKDWK